MEAELAALAASGATALVELLVSETFGRIKRPLARFLRRRAGGDVAEDELQADSQVARSAQADGDADAVADVQARWQARLERIFRDDPDAAGELARLLEELAPGASPGFVSLVSGGVNYGPAFQGSHIHGGIVFNVQPSQPSSASGWQRPDQVPAVTVPFSNRTAELAALDWIFGAETDGRHRVDVAVLEGLPGVGKSTTAWWWSGRVRDRFPDGQLYVDFAALRDQSAPSGSLGGDVSEALAICLRSLPGGTEIPDSLAARTNLFRSRSANLRILLVLDDVVQPSQVRALIPKGSGSGVLVTSQGRLSELFLEGTAQPVPVRPLDLHGGLALLKDRCGPEAVEADRDAAERLVALCGGLPVGLQVVAARLLTDDCPTLAELADELEDEAGRLAGLALYGEESPVSVALGPSYRLLTADAARLYHLLGWAPLGVFDAGVAAVAADVDTSTAKRLLGVLVKAGLIETSRDGRYRMHDLVRLHARARAVEEEPETAYAALTERVTTHYLVLAGFADRAVRQDRLRVTRLADLLRGAEDPFAVPGGPEPLEWLDTERPAILAVLRTAGTLGLYNLVWQLAEVFTVLFLHRRYLGAWKESLELGAEAAKEAAARAGTAADVAQATAAEARLRSLLSRPLLDLGEDDRAGRELARAATLAETSGDLHVHASALEFLGRYQDRFGTGEAVATLQHCRELNQRAGEVRGAALAAFFLGTAKDSAGDHGGAMATLLQAQREFAALAEPDPRMAARVGAAMGVVHDHLGETDAAVHELREAVQTLEERQARHYAAEALEALAGITRRQGGPEQLVHDYLSRARAIYEASGNPRAEALRRELEEPGA